MSALADSLRRTERLARLAAEGDSAAAAEVGVLARREGVTETMGRALARWAESLVERAGVGRDDGPALVTLLCAGQLAGIAAMRPLALSGLSAVFEATAPRHGTVSWHLPLTWSTRGLAPDDERAPSLVIPPHGTFDGAELAPQPEQVDLLLRQAWTAQLHEGWPRPMLRLLELVELEGRPTALCEPCRAGTLADELPASDPGALVHELVEAVVALHGAGRVHRNLAPHTLVRTAAGELAMFGAVPAEVVWPSERLIWGGSPGLRVARIGPPEHSPLELARASDLVALAAILARVHGADAGLEDFWASHIWSFGQLFERLRAAGSPGELALLEPRLVGLPAPLRQWIRLVVVWQLGREPGLREHVPSAAALLAMIASAPELAAAPAPGEPATPTPARPALHRRIWQWLRGDTK